MSVHVKLILFACFTSYVASFNAQGIYKSIKTDYVVEQEAVISNVDFKIKLKDSKPKVSSPLRFTNQQKPKGDSYETYKPNWDDLDKRPLPTWYDEAKIGIFIHWGVFSVPSFRSEWFWWDWQGAKYNNTVDFMKKNYRPGFTYADFAPKFTAEFFNADQWADIFNTSGARYVVFTSKHHEGYTNWPSNYSFNWNSMAVGPKRDIVGELSTALRKRNLHVGLYHSLFEWFHPLYLQDKENKFRTQQFVKSKTLPELYELVNTYKPDVIWSDGDWEALDTYWNSTEFIAWLYNDSPVKDSVVTNDRWGSGVMCKHGGYFTCSDRYNPGKLQSRKWENAMTIDSQSWGYRRNANLSDYLSIEQLIDTIVETVSCGGNILVNVGPSHDGVIKPIFQERLSQMGEWLKVNGEAIYSSVPWKFQNDTVTPKVWYTERNTDKVKTVYAIILQWPENDALLLGAPAPSKDTTVHMLGSDMSFTWTKGPSRENKTSNIKDSTEFSPQQSAYSNDDAGLGKLRYIAGRCIAKSKYHYMTIGKNNMYKKNKQSCVTDCFLKVKILDYMTTTYADLLESSSYKESLEETKRKQNLTQGLTDIKDDVLDFFVDIDRNRIKYQNEKMFHKHGSNIFNFVHEKLLSSKTLFSNFQKLLQNFDLTATFVRVDEDLAMACLKALYSDLILRFCRVSDNQFRKDLIKSFGMQKSETLRKRVVETAKRDNTSKQISMSYILNDKSENKISSHLKLQSCICDSGTLVLKCFTKKQLMCLGKAYDINMSIKDTKQAMCDNLLATVPNFISIPNVGQLTNSEDNEQAVENLEHVPVVEDRKQSASKKGSKRKRKPYTPKSRITRKKNLEKIQKDEIVCSICSCKFNTVDERIQCDICDNWYHKECQNISADQLIDKTEDDWYCMKCCE